MLWWECAWRAFRNKDSKMQARVTAETAFRLLAEGMSRARSDDFFPMLVAKLGEILNVDHVLVAQVDRDDRAHTLAIWSRGELQPNLSYDLAGTPCESVAGEKECLYPDAVRQRFPEDELLHELGAESYMGLPLYALDGRPLGLLAVLKNRPMTMADLESEILHIAAAQAAAQIERSLASQAMQESEALARESERRLELLLNHLPGMAYRCLYDAEWTMLVVSQGAEPLTGYAPHALINNREVSYASLIHPLDRAKVDADVDKALAARGPFRTVYRLRTASGHWRWVLEQGQALYDAEGETEVLEGFISDITEQYEAQRVQDAVARVASAITTRIGDGFFHQLVRQLVEILEADAGFIATFSQGITPRPEGASPSNRYLSTVSVVADDARLGNHAFDLSTSPFAALATMSESMARLDRPLHWLGVAEPPAAWIGRRLDNTQGEPVGIIVVVYRDPPEATGFASSVLRILSSGAAAEVERRQDHRRMRQLAYFDEITGLANRVRFMEDLEAMRDEAEREQQPLGLLLLDLRRFKEINDLHGHHLGDQLLAILAGRLQRSLKEGETLARLSGDEFTLLVPAASPSRLEESIARMRGVIARPIYLEHHSFSFKVSIGLASYPHDALSPGELFKAASIALYHAKREDEGVCPFSASMRHDLERRQQMTERLGDAIRENRLALHYMPQVDLRTRQLTGAEALCRWQDARWGWVSPGEFIPLAEERGLIRSLGDRVLEQATRQLLEWKALGMRLPGRLSLNISAQQFADPNLADHVKRLTRGLSATAIALELTESDFMRDPEQAVVITRALREAGFTLAIDDFGTGYSSLAYLRRFSAQALKIDMSFVRHMLANPHDRTIVDTIIAMAQSLGMKTVAEGVETAEQAEALAEMGCDEAQGYFFGPPLAAEDFASHWLDRAQDEAEEPS